MTLNEIIEMWDSEVIPSKGKSIVIQAFLADFGYKSRSTLKHILSRQSHPTPQELSWLSEKVLFYYTHYKELEEELVNV